MSAELISDKHKNHKQKDVMYDRYQIPYLPVLHNSLFCSNFSLAKNMEEEAGRIPNNSVHAQALERIDSQILYISCFSFITRTVFFTHKTTSMTNRQTYCKSSLNSSQILQEISNSLPQSSYHWIVIPTFLIIWWAAPEPSDDQNWRQWEPRAHPC